MAFVSEISVRVLRNTGNYENVTVEFTALLDEQDSPELVREQLAEQVEFALDETIRAQRTMPRGKPRVAAAPADDAL